MQVRELEASERWRQIVDSRREQMDGAFADLERTGADFWPRRGNRLSMLRRPAADDDRLLQRALTFCRGGTALDVGAGAGRYSIPLALNGVHVTAIEPETVMLDAMREEATTAGVDSIAIIQQRWLETEVEPADLVLCAHVIYPFVEVVPFLTKLDEHARRAVVLGLTGTWREPQVLLDLWRHFHGSERLLQPGYIDAYLMLHELGIPANVEIVPQTANFWSFDGLDDAVAAVREHLILPESPDVDATLRRELEGALQSDGERLSLPQVERFQTIIWWERDGPRLGRDHED